MARVTHTKNTVSFVTDKIISHEDLVSTIEFVKDTYSTDKPDLFWIGAMAERWFETAVFFALNSELKGFDCSEALTQQLKGIEGMTNTYKVDFAPSLEFTKEGYFKKNGISLVTAQVERLRDFPIEYNAPARMDVLKALAHIKEMDKASKEFIQLTEDAATQVENRIVKVKAIWDKVDMLQAREYPDATIGDLYDIPETQVYHMINKMEATFESARRSLLGKASIAGIEDNQRDKDFFIQSSASAGLVAEYCGKLIAEADTVDQTNVQDEISRDLDTKGESNSEIARQQYEAANGLPHGSVGNGSGNGDSIYDGTVEAD